MKKGRKRNQGIIEGKPKGQRTTCRKEREKEMRKNRKGARQGDGNKEAFSVQRCKAHLGDDFAHNI